VSYGIIERHNGLITVESELGKGATFHIDLPVADICVATPCEARTIEQTESLSILVIDDEEFVRETLGEMLAELKHRVVTVDSGRAARKLGAQKFDVCSRISPYRKWMAGRPRAKSGSIFGIAVVWSPAMVRQPSLLR
jgi:hypothetical protein